MTINLVMNSIKLFGRSPVFTKNTNKINQASFKKLVEAGIRIDLPILSSLSQIDQETLTYFLTENYGVSNEQLRASFYKKFETVFQASELELFVNQILHYMSTYGNIDELKTDGRVYVPEHVEMDLIKESLKLFKSISLMTTNEFNEELSLLLQSNVPLNSNDVTSLYSLTLFAAKYFDFNMPESISNKELSCMLYKDIFAQDHKTLPRNASDFMRLLIYMKTDKTLMIKDIATLRQLKNDFFWTPRDNDMVSLALNAYVDQYGYIPLAESFNRFKPFYLKLKHTNRSTAKIVNKISRLSKKHHVPMKKDLLSNLADILLNSNEPQKVISELMQKLEKAPSYQLVKVFNATNLKQKQLTREVTARSFRIRNGKTFTMEQKNDKNYDAYNKNLLQVANTLVLTELANRAKKIYEGKSVVLPEDIDLKVPTSTKSFIGELPDFSNIEVENNVALGINWTKDGDIDLSMETFDGSYISWHSMQRTTDIAHTGDMTYLDKTGNANETIFISENYKKSTIFNQTIYWSQHEKLNSKVTIADNVDVKSYADKANVKLILPIEVENLPGNFAMLTEFDENNKRKFIFSSISLAGRSVASRDLNKYIYSVMVDKCESALSLKTLLDYAGVDIISKQDASEQDASNIVDFSLDTLNKQMFINLLK